MINGPRELQQAMLTVHASYPHELKSNCTKISPHDK